MAYRKNFWVSLLGAVLILFLVSSAGPARDTMTSGPEAEMAEPISEISEVFGVSEASAKNKKKRKHTRRRRTPTLPPNPPPSTISPKTSGRWSDATIWGNSPPQAGAAVTIPAGIEVVFDESPEALKSLQIDGTLTFDERDLGLRADWIIVHGKLQVGTEEAPFRHKASISLTGTDKTENVMNMGTKVSG